MCGKKALRGVGLLGMGLAAALFAHAAPVQAATGINQQLTFQGKVVNSSGVNLADGTYDMEFKIYQDGNSSGTGSTLMWTEDYLVPGSTGMPSTGGVTVSGGTFNVNLGSICALAGSTCGAKTNTGVDFNQDTLWLSFQVGNTSSCTVTSSTTSFHTGCGGDGEMTPFIRLTAVPQAMNANRVGGLTASQLVQLSPSGGTQTGTIDVSGNIKSGGQLQANTLDAAASGALSLGGTNATGITLLDNLTGGSSITATLQGTNALTLGSTSAAGGILFQDGTSNNRTVTLTTPGLANNYSLSWATSGATGNECLQSTSGSTNTVTALQWGSCGGGVSLAAVDSAGSANANGATLTGTVLNLNSADGTHPGVLNAGTQTIGGAKTFSALVTGSAGLSVSGGAITLQGNSASTLTTSSGNLTLDATSASTPTIGLGTGAQNKTITVGNTQSSTTTTIQGGTTTLTTANAGVTVQNTAATGSVTAFQVTDPNNIPVFLVDTQGNDNNLNTNLLSNPGFENGTTGWSGSGTGASCAQITPTTTANRANIYYGMASLDCTLATSSNTTVTINGATGAFTTGATLPASTSYNLSFYAKASGSVTFAAGSVTFVGPGTTCTPSPTGITTTGFQRFSCNVTTSGTATTSITIVTATNNLHVYLDSVQLTSGTSGGATPQLYRNGNVQLRGVVNNPAEFQAFSQSTTAFQIQDSNGLNMLTADTYNGLIQIGSATANTNTALVVLNNYSNTSTEPTGVNGAIYYNTGGMRGAGPVAGGLAGKFRCFEGGLWKNCIGMRDIAERRWGYGVPNGTAATTYTVTGNITLGGASAAGTSSGQAESNYINYATTTTIGSANGIDSGAVAATQAGGVTSQLFTTTETRWLPKLVTRVRVDGTAVTTARYWVALASAGLTGSDSTGSFIGLRFSTNASDTSWVCASSNGTTTSTFSTGVTVTAGHAYDIILDLSTSGTLVCSVADDGTTGAQGAFVSATLSTNLPGTSTPLGIEASVTALAGSAARNMAIAYSYLESN